MSTHIARPDRFREAMSRVATTVCVVTTDGPHGRAGVTVSAMCSLSLEPPSVLACVHHESRALPAFTGNRVFCVNVLGDDQEQVANAFAGLVPEFREDRFGCAEWETLTTGAPVLKGALASFDCNLSDLHPFGSHRILMGTVADLAMREGNSLVYADRAFRKFAH